jgi:tetratricopeptide (TPR) repeat protein
MFGGRSAVRRAAAGLAVAALAAGLVSSVRAQRDARRVEDWLAAIAGHLPGQPDLWIDRVAGWSSEELEAAFERYRLTAPDPAEFSRTAKRAARLHADVAMLRRSPIGEAYDLPAYGRRMMQTSDGRVVTTSTGTFHWPFARRVLDRIATPSEDGYVRLWYRATAATLQSWSYNAELEPHLRRALELFPTDPFLLTYAGTLHAAYAEPRVQGLLRPPNFAVVDPATVVSRPLPGTVLTGSFESPAAELAKAERFLRQAVVADATLAEARIRLAYVLGNSGRPADALAELDRVAGLPRGALMQYYTLIIRGRELHALGRAPGAISALEEASRLYPRAQSPRLLISQVARDRGDRRRAVSELDLLAMPVSDRDREDPWWIFGRVHEPLATDLVAALRAAEP